MINPGDKIVIAGDSWGCGEWDFVNGNYTVSHLGLEKYLTDYGCEVYNLSKGGSSNHVSVNTLSYKFVKILNPDIVFWFQTDPIRDLRPYNKTFFPQTVSDLIKQQHVLINKTYARLNALGMKINCIGGTVKLFPSIANYPNLNSFMGSVVEFFGGTAPEFWISDWIQCDDLISSDFLDELYTTGNTGINHPNRALPKEWFSPDGIHPNRFAHQKIFEFILTC
jgi:hypothetical protein